MEAAALTFSEVERACRIVCEHEDAVYQTYAMQASAFTHQELLEIHRNTLQDEEAASVTFAYPEEGLACHRGQAIPAFVVATADEVAACLPPEYRGPEPGGDGPILCVVQTNSKGPDYRVPVLKNGALMASSPATVINVPAGIIPQGTLGRMSDTMISTNTLLRHNHDFRWLRDWFFPQTIESGTPQWKNVEITEDNFRTSLEETPAHVISCVRRVLGQNA